MIYTVIGYYFAAGTIHNFDVNVEVDSGRVHDEEELAVRTAEQRICKEHNALMARAETCYLNWNAMVEAGLAVRVEDTLLDDMALMLAIATAQGFAPLEEALEEAFV